MLCSPVLIAFLPLALPGHCQDPVLDALKGLRARATSQSSPWKQGVESNLPDWESFAETTLGSGGDLLRGMRQSTVIVKTRGGWGSGGLLEAGLIFTNHHVVEDSLALQALEGTAPKIEVIFCEVDGARIKKGKTVKAEVVCCDPAHDLALLRVEEKSIPAGSVPIELSTDEVELGGPVFSVGSQGGGLAFTVKSGTVSGLYSYPADLTDLLVLTKAGQEEQSELVRRLEASVVVTDCTISPGDSGGPLFDFSGKLAGVTFATPTNLTQGSVGYHIESRHLADLVRSRRSEKVDAPLDLWTGSDPEHGVTLMGAIGEASAVNCLALLYLKPGPSGESEEYGRCLLYADKPLRMDAATFENPRPKGLGLKNPNVAFSRFVLLRRDGWLVSGRLDSGELGATYRVLSPDRDLFEMSYRLKRWRRRSAPDGTDFLPLEGLSDSRAADFEQAISAFIKS